MTRLKNGRMEACVFDIKIAAISELHTVYQTKRSQKTLNTAELANSAYWKIYDLQGKELDRKD